MTAPSLNVYQNGVNQVSGDQLNTFAQTCNIVTDLRAFIGTSGVQVYMRGFTSVGDGGQGVFYWNASGTGPDDGGVTNIVPSGSTTGCWTRLNNVQSGALTSKSTGFTLISTNAYVPYLATASLTITLSKATTFNSLFWIDIFAQGGNVTLAPNIADKVQNLTAGQNFIIYQGSSCRLYTDGSANWWLYFWNVSNAYYTATGAPVNSLQTLFCGTGFFPTLQAIGSDTNIGIVYASKGNLGHVFNTNGPQTGSPVTQLTVGHTASATNWVSITGSNGSQPTISIAGASANAGLNIAGTGIFTVPGVNSNTTASAANVNVDSSGNIKKSTSSIKYKRDVRDYDKGMEYISQLHPVYYKSKEESDGDRDYAGFIAESIDELGLKEFVSYQDEDPDGLMYQNMTALLVKGIQEINERLIVLENR